MSGRVYDVAIVGGGAAGLAAAVSVPAPLGAVVIERQGKLGRRLLASGNGRANVSHEPLSPDDYNADSRGWLRRLPEMQSSRAAAELLRRLSVLTFRDEAGRLYPRSRQALTVLRAFTNALAARGTDVLTETDVLAIERPASAGRPFRLETTNGVVSAAAVIVAVGGRAAPNLGGGNHAERLLVPLGFQFSPASPALVPLTLGDRSLIRQCAGVRFLARGRLQGGPYRAVSDSEGEYMISREGLSGIAAMRLARAVSREKAGLLHLDLAPDLSEDDVARFFSRRLKDASISAGSFHFDGLLPDKLAAWLENGIRRQARRIASLDDEIRQRVRAVKQLELELTGTLGFESAQIAAGGLSLREVEADSLQSRRCPGLFFAGELLDVDGDTGGFNLHFAFASGVRAGRAAGGYASSIKSSSASRPSR